MNEIVCGLNQLRDILKSKKIYCFGAGIQGKRWIYILEDWGLADQIQGLIDNAPEKIGQQVVGNQNIYQILALQEIIHQDHKDTCILLTTLSYVPIIDQMKALHYDGVVIAVDKVAETQLMISDYPEIVKESDTMLIPKIIHYVWLGGSMPGYIQKNIESWKRFCPDYEIIKWDDKNYDVTKNKYMYEAYQKGAWSFVSDYIRLDVISKYGGIYLDTDIELVKNIDDLLYQECFGCSDASFVMNTGNGFGARPGCEIINELRDYYEDVSFVMEDGKIDNTSCNSHNFQVLRKYGFKVNDQFQKIKEMNIYPMILAGASAYTEKSRVTDKTYWIHYGNMSWMKHNIVDSKL